MPDSEDESKLELERLRLASDLRQLAKETPDPDLREHWLRMAKQVDEPDKDDTVADKDAEQ